MSEPNQVRFLPFLTRLETKRAILPPKIRQMIVQALWQVKVPKVTRIKLKKIHKINRLTNRLSQVELASAAHC